MLDQLREARGYNVLRPEPNGPEHDPTTQHALIFVEGIDAFFFLFIMIVNLGNRNFCEFYFWSFGNSVARIFLS